MTSSTRLAMQRRKRAILARKRSSETQAKPRDLGQALTGLVIAWRDLLVRSRVVDGTRGERNRAA